MRLLHTPGDPALCAGLRLRGDDALLDVRTVPDALPLHGMRAPEGIMSDGPPLLPPPTCPTLDGILREVNRPPDQMSVTWLENAIETVRMANQALRLNAEHYKELAKDLQGELNDARGDIRAIEDKVADLKEKLKSAEALMGE